MARDLSWLPEGDGVLHRYPVVDGLEGHAWLQARRPYCDRGHWEWGWSGLAGDGGPEPSYYFMDLERMALEVQAWLQRLEGRWALEPEDVPVGPAAYEPAADAGWAWTGDPDARHLAHADARLTLVREAHPTGSCWTLTAEGIDGLDSADRFPRHYLSLTRAVREAESFLAWRMLRIPEAFPGPLEQALEVEDPHAVAPSPRKSWKP